MARLALDDSGISEIVGALMLILIVVIAAAGLAMIVSQAQKDQANRQAQIDAVNNEKLKIVSMIPYYNSTGILIYIDLNVQNLNIDSSKIVTATVNNIFVKNMTIEPSNIQYNYTNALPIPASGNLIIRINMSDNLVHVVDFDKSSSITVQLVTSYENYFSDTITSPTAVIKASIDTENIGVGQRDYILLDGSDSTSDGQITSWNWLITDGSRTRTWNSTNSSWDSDPGNWNDPMTGDFNYFNLNGKVVRFTPQSYGPFNISLNVTDSNGMSSRTVYEVIPASQNFDPPAYLTAKINGTNITDGVNITATITDSYNNPLQNIWVYFTIFVDNIGNLVLTPQMGMTDSNGTVKTTISNGSISNPLIINGSGSGNYTVRVSSGSLIPVDIRF